MDILLALWMLGLAFSTDFLTNSQSIAFASERPYALVACALAASAVALLTKFPTIRTKWRAAPHKDEDQENIPLAEVDNPSRERSKSQVERENRSRGVLSPGRLRLSFLLLVAGLCARLELTRHILTFPECAHRGWNLADISVLVAYAAWRSAKTEETVKEHVSKSSSKWPAGSYTWGLAVYFIVALVLFTIEIRPPRSSYICSITSWRFHYIPVMQFACVVLDLSILILAIQLILRGRESTGVRVERSFHALGVALLVSAMIGMIIALLAAGFFFSPRSYHLIFPTLRAFFTKDTILTAGAFALGLSCAVRIFCRMELLIVLITIIYVHTTSIALRLFLVNYEIFPPLTPAHIFACVGASTAVIILAIRPTFSIPRVQRLTGVQDAISAPNFPKVMLAGLFALQLLLWLIQPTLEVEAHPVKELMAQANVRHRKWLAQASKSKSVSSAAQEYRRRYGMDPPPRFDSWVEYAKLNRALFLDDFDNIHNNLLPFWSMDPAEIRSRSLELVSTGKIYVGGVMITNGRTTITKYVPDTHRWMLEGVESMIMPFAKWLPDMIIPFNMNDECRVAVPFADLENMRREAKKVIERAHVTMTEYKTNSITTWGEIPDEPLDNDRFLIESLYNSWDRWGSIGCSPSSPARTKHYHNTGRHCHECAAPHMRQQFLANWALSADPCHQPDLQFLHGLYLSPSTMIDSHELMPVFSQSRAEGFNDILYPSAWYYKDKTVYAPSAEEEARPWGERISKLFWRGATTEGYSKGNGAWQGMGRQRLVHMMHNATEPDTSIVLVPKDQDRRKWRYRIKSPSELHARTGVEPDTRFVETIERCAWRDCPEQYREFVPEAVPRADFQSMWKYQYLIDVDGAGFSGRFLPFLQSKSLPFKARLMREWWDDRVTPWLHFVPVDLRMQEIWSLLVFFGGWKTNDGEGWLSEPHDAEAEKIAYAGRDWANKVLRKEDMEIYLFRLLLEWGRVTNDDREILGFRGDLDAETAAANA